MSYHLIPPTTATRPELMWRGMCFLMRHGLLCHILVNFENIQIYQYQYIKCRKNEGADLMWATSVFISHSGQWGVPTVSLAGVLGIMGGIVCSMAESVGDYHACAKLSGAPPPPKHAISRGIGMEGLGCLLAGAFGTGNGTTSFSENIAVLGITKVSKPTILNQRYSLLAITYDYKNFFLTGGQQDCDPPEWSIYDSDGDHRQNWSHLHHHSHPCDWRNVYCGFWCHQCRGHFKLAGEQTVVSSWNQPFKTWRNMLTHALLKSTDMNSSRNIFIFGFSMFSALVIPNWIMKNPDFLQTSIYLLGKDRK